MYRTSKKKKKLGFPGSSAGKESDCNAGNPSSISGSGRYPGENRLPTPVFLGFPCGSAGKEFAWLGKIPWRRERLPILILWPGEFSPWAHKELDTTEQLSLSYGIHK